jgi:hypothetical protein
MMLDETQRAKGDNDPQRNKNRQAEKGQNLVTREIEGEKKRQRSQKGDPRLAEAPDDLANARHFLIMAGKLFDDYGRAIPQERRPAAMLSGFLNFAVADAGSANTDTLAGALDERMHALQVQIPAPLRHVMGVADFMPELWSTATDFTNFCHRKLLL